MDDECTLIKFGPSALHPITNFFCGDWKNISSLVIPRCPSSKASSTGELPSSDATTKSWTHRQNHYLYSVLKKVLVSKTDKLAHAQLDRKVETTPTPKSVPGTISLMPPKACDNEEARLDRLWRLLTQYDTHSQECGTISLSYAAQSLWQWRSQAG